MLTPEKIQAMNKASGLNVPPAGGPPPGPSRADQIRAIGKSVQDTKVNTAVSSFQRLADKASMLPTPFAPALKIAGSPAALEEGKKIVGGITDTLKKNAPTAGTDLGGEISTGADLAGKISGVPFQVAGDAINELIPQGVKDAAGDTLHSALEAIKANPQSKAALDTVNKIVAEHPHVAQLLGGLLTTALNVGTGGAAGAVKDTVASGLETVAKESGELAANMVPKVGGKANSLDKTIKASMPLEDKSVRIDALRNSMPEDANGGVTRKGMFGKSTIDPNAEDVRRGTTAHEYIKDITDPVAQIQNLNKGIKDVSGETDSFLNTQAAPANFADMREYMETNRPISNLQKDPGATEAYNRATQDALDTLYTTMKKSAKESGDFGAVTSAADIRKARIAIDNQISKELGENTFGTPQYKGIKAAEIDTRNLLNRMSEDMLRYPGQMEKLNTMNDFISSAKARGIEVDLNNPAVRMQLEGQFGLKATTESEAAAQELTARHLKMSDLYETRDNIIDKYQSSIGKNKVQEAIKNSPALKAGTDVAKKVIPFGIGTHL